MATTCSVCGAQNDPSSRFCDQCGAALPGDTPAPQPTAVAVTTCPTCGSPVLPGEAFCGECGAPLSAAAPAAADAPTEIAPAAMEPESRPLVPEPQPLPHDQPTVIVAAPASIPGDLPPTLIEASPAMQLPDAVSSPETTAAATLEPQPVEPAPLSGDVTLGPDAQATNGAATPEVAAPDVIEPSDELPVQPAPDPDSVATQASVEAPMPDVIEPSDELPPPPPVSAEPVPAEAAPEAAVSVPPPAQTIEQYEAERERLEGEVATQQQLIGQLDQLQATFGAAAPPAVAQGLAQAQESLARAQAQLAALVPPAPAVDPEEVRRVEEEIATQQQLIGQLEQLVSTFGAAAPPAVVQGLGDARAALADAESRLAALSGGAAAPAPPAAEPALTPPAPPAAEPALTPPAPPAAEPALTPPAPRLVVEEGGAELPLDPVRQLFVVGREDPISGIHPEIDLTPYGGETGGVSRQHARLERSGDQWTLTDLDSTNYTRVDGTRLEPNLPTPISDGARLQFGRLVLTFRM